MLHQTWSISYNAYLIAVYNFSLFVYLTLGIDGHAIPSSRLVSKGKEKVYLVQCCIFMSNEAIPFDVVHKHLSKSSKFLYLSWVIFVESEILTT